MTEAQLANLKKGKMSMAERGRRGGIRSGESKRDDRSMREFLEAWVQTPSEHRPGLTKLQSICVELSEQAERGVLKAVELFRDTIGQKPTEKDNNRVSGNVIVQWQQAIQGESSSSVSIGTNTDSNTISIDAQQAQVHEAITQE